MWLISQIQSLSENEIAPFFIGKQEGKTNDFKIKLNLETDKDRKEFLADVSSFANAEGGTLVFGAKESKGICEEAQGVKVENADLLKQRLENLLREGIQPNIPYYDIHIAELPSGNNLIIIEIQQSYVKPHVVDYKGHWRVYSRNTAGKFPLDIFDLKSMVTSSGEMVSGLSKFRNQRISAILAEELPFKFENPNGPKLVVHAIPHSSFYKSLPLNLIEIGKWTDLVKPVGSEFSKQKFNFDGLLSISSDGMNNNVIDKYFQLYRNGVVETVNNDLSREDYDQRNGVLIDAICQEITRFVQRIKELYGKLQINAPVYILISLLDMHEQHALLKRGHDHFLRKFDRNNLLLPEVIISDYNCEIELREAFDMIWNSVGYDKAYL